MQAFGSDGCMDMICRCNFLASSHSHALIYRQEVLSSRNSSSLTVRTSFPAGSPSLPSSQEIGSDCQTATIPARQHFLPAHLSEAVDKKPAQNSDKM